MSDLKIEIQYSDKLYDTFIIEGLSAAETDRVLNDHGSLAEVLAKHGITCRKNIVDIKHFGGHLLVKVGRNI